MQRAANRIVGGRFAALCYRGKCMQRVANRIVMVVSRFRRGISWQRRFLHLPWIEYKQGTAQKGIPFKELRDCPCILSSFLWLAGDLCWIAHRSGEALSVELLTPQPERTFLGQLTKWDTARSHLACGFFSIRTWKPLCSRKHNEGHLAIWLRKSPMTIKTFVAIKSPKCPWKMCSWFLIENVPNSYGQPQMTVKTANVHEVWITWSRTGLLAIFSWSNGPPRSAQGSVRARLRLWLYLLCRLPQERRVRCGERPGMRWWFAGSLL